MPATNSASEMSFSAFIRVKTYLRSTINQERKDRWTQFVASIANTFVDGNETRLRELGKF